MLLADERPGLTTLVVSGAGAAQLFADEAGGHRWQRVPPTEKRGRMQTSTITVAVLPASEAGDVQIDPKDLDIRVTRGSGPGGQHRNKTETAIQLLHKPTGILVRCETERSQHQNRATALQILSARLQEANRSSHLHNTNAQRAGQIGSGQRGDKRRTIRSQDNRVTDHVTGRVWRYADYIKGEW